MELMLLFLLIQKLTETMQSSRCAISSALCMNLSPLTSCRKLSISFTCALQISSRRDLSSTSTHLKSVLRSSYSTIFTCVFFGVHLAYFSCSSVHLCVYPAHCFVHSVELNSAGGAMPVCVSSPFSVGFGERRLFHSARMASYGFRIWI